MLNSIVGPAVKGVADFASPKNADKRDKKSTGSDSFGNVLEEKSSSKSPIDREPLGANKAVDSPKTVRDTSQNRESERKKPDAEKVIAKKDSDPKESVSKEPDKSAKGTSQREQAILKFMDSFESEFGVPPTKIVEAMATLKQNEQDLSPEETADQVIDQLNLSDDEKDPAKGMYIGLLAQLGQMEKPAALPPKPEMGLYANGSQGRFEQVQVQKGALNQSLESMNEKFWMKGPNVAPTTPDVSKNIGESLGEGVSSMDLQQQIEANPSFKIDPSKLNPQMQKALQAVKDANPTASPEVALAALVAAARAQKAQAAGDADADADDSDLQSLPGSSSAAVAGADLNKASGQAVAPKEGMPGYEDPSSGRQAANQFSQQSHQQNETGMNAKTTKGEVASKDKISKSTDFDSKLRLEGMPTPVPLKDLGVAAPVATPAGTFVGAAGKSEDKADIKQIMNQAQYLIKRGGGEMKVEMSPEGMGKIHMKVLVENGKVNVQMSAETNEAKKAIEGGLSELKNSLAAHQLSMDHIKVDVVNKTNTDNTAQNQLNQQHQQGSREQTRQFWNNFSENFGSPSQQRESFTDIPSLRGYARARTDKPIEPLRAQAAGYGAAGKGKGLNLVA